MFEPKDVVHDAAREVAARDAGDLVTLYRLCGFRGVEQALQHVEEHAPSSLLLPKSELLLRELLTGVPRGPRTDVGRALRPAMTLGSAKS